MKEIDITNIEDLPKIAKHFIDNFPPPRCFAFSGNLGSGKTTFIQHLVKAVGITEVVTSPTYSLVNQYGDGDNTVYHLDLYRLNDWQEAINIGIEEILDSTSYVWIEWPEIIEHLLPDNTLHLNFKVKNDKRYLEYG